MKWNFKFKRPINPILNTFPIAESFSVPEYATNTLYTEGIPLDASKREISHIFRPFPGFIEVRIILKHKEGN